MYGIKLGRLNNVLKYFLKMNFYIIHLNLQDTESLQARVLEWVAISFSRGSSQPRDRSQVSHIAGRCFTNQAMQEAHWEGGYGELFSNGDRLKNSRDGWW